MDKICKIEKTYNPQNIEQKWYKTWENNNYFKNNLNLKESYTIMLPPPNVTGTLHMGHGFQHTLMDILIRYNRMLGKDTLWQAGTDHAGIATQMVVERKLLQKGISRHNLGRENFIKKIWEFKDNSKNTISSQMKRIGDSIDWSRERFTMDNDFSKSVRKLFIKLYKDNLVYKGKKLVNWDPILHTAISDLEVINEEIKGSLWYFKYPIKDSNEFLTIATTRPETILGDTAVAVNPNDERYKNLVGKTILLPLTKREVPIINDNYVEKEFGTGCVKITPAHDFNDYEVGKRNNLKFINILTKDAKLNENVPKDYQGLDRFIARKKIIEDMKNLNLLEKIEPHNLKVPKGDRTNVILEPYLTEQWFIKTKDLAKPAIKAVENKEIRFIPDNWKNTYYSWMNDIQDWCISRQLWWGHRIPAFYDKDNNIYVEENENEVRKKYNLDSSIELVQDNDVFDTWFSSSLWPFSTIGWEENSEYFKKHYPNSVLVTGFDIIFFWVARMIMMGIYCTKEIPFKDIYITGLIKDSNGKKMSKSKGNVLDPVDLIDGISLENLIKKRTSSLMQPKMKEQIIKQTSKEFKNGINSFGADALRFTFCALASTSRDICFDVNRMEGYRNFCNKIWNASRFIILNLENDKNFIYDEKNIFNKKLSIIEKWIISELQETIKNAHNYLKEYRFDLIAKNLYDFIWNKYCDWFLEFSKIDLTNSVKNTLIFVLETSLKLLHPIIPFITEEIYQNLRVFTKKTSHLINENYPMYNKDFININDVNMINNLQNIITSLRTVRTELNLKPSLFIEEIFIKNADNKFKNDFYIIEKFIKNLAKIEKITFLEKNIELPNSSIINIEKIKFYIPLKGLINIDDEKNRINKEINKIDKEILRVNNKLQNEKFIKNAPQNIIEKEKNKLKSFMEKKLLLNNEFKKLEA